MGLSVVLPARTPRPPTGPTSQRIVLVDPPVSVAAKVTVFAVPEVTWMGVAQGDMQGEVMATVGAGVMVTVEVAETFGSTNETAVTLTGLEAGTAAGA